VKITRGEMVLTADTVRLHRATRVATAEGNVVLTDPQGRLAADALTIDLVEETGSLDEGSVYLNKNRYQLTGRRFEKLPGQSYRVTDGRFTTCLCGEGRAPSWSVRGRRVILDLEGYCRVEGGTFAVRDVPVLYLPYGVFPVKRERQTGLLFPRFGFSNRRGVQVTQPFYVDISKSQDVTLTLDVETEARVGLLGEYRYALSRATQGELHGSYFNERIRGASAGEIVNRRIADPNIPEDRWSAGLTHDQWLPWEVRGFADVFRVSDDLFLREINVFTFNPGVDVALRTRRYERSRVGAQRLFDRGLVGITGTWYQDFINPDEFVFRTPPRLEALASTRLWDDRVMVHFAGEGVRFERDRGFEGQRLDLRPEVEVPWRLGRYAFGAVSGGFRETLYRLDDRTVPEQVNVNPADPASPPPSILPALREDATREVFYLRGEAGTALARVTPVHRYGIARVKHTIEPRLGYLFVPRTDTRQATLPLFDDVDRINRRSVLTYGVTSRLLARMEDAPPAAGGADEGANDARPSAAAPADGDSRGGGTVRELGRLSLFQSYDALTRGGDFIRDEDDPGGAGHRVSDLALHLRLTPADFIGLEGRTDYSVTGDGAKGATVGLVLSDPRVPADDFTLPALRGRSQVGVGYRFVANGAVEEINGGVLLRLSKRFYGAYETRYDNRSTRFLENRYGLRLISECECWVLDVGISDKLNPDETEVRVLLTLVGLGQVGREPFAQALTGLAAAGDGLLGR
jgi:LPS-assembly protein